MVLGSKGTVWFQTLSRYSFLLMVKVWRPTRKSDKKQGTSLMKWCCVFSFMVQWWFSLRLFLICFYDMLCWFNDAHLKNRVSQCRFGDASSQLDVHSWANDVVTWLGKRSKKWPNRNPDFCDIDVLASFFAISTTTFTVTPCYLQQKPTKSRIHPWVLHVVSPQEA